MSQLKAKSAARTRLEQDNNIRCEGHEYMRFDLDLYRAMSDEKITESYDQIMCMKEDFARDKRRFFGLYSWRHFGRFFLGVGLIALSASIESTVHELSAILILVGVYLIYRAWNAAKEDDQSLEFEERMLRTIEMVRSERGADTGAEA
ncbi:MAG: hypothetical protein HQL45_17430 [Alphaproteobacteria bacterium]|nr:hypothetical protein [Alphaproteobacteria bacterium]